MPASVGLALIAMGIENMTRDEQWLSFLNTGFLGILVIVGLHRGSPNNPANGDPITSQGRNLTIRQAISPWQVIIGQTRIGGTLTFAFLSADKKYMHFVVTLASHVCEEIGDVWIDDEIVTPAMLDGNGFVTSGKYGPTNPVAQRSVFNNISPGTVSFTVGSVQSVTAIYTNPFTDVDTWTVLIDVSPSAPSLGEYSRSGQTFTFNSEQVNVDTDILVDYTENSFFPFCRIKKSIGAEAGQPFADLVSESEGKWTDAHRQTGHTKLYIRFDTSALAGGAPQISAILKGMKLYDPRTTLTTWSANPALAQLAYIMDTEIGLGAALSETGAAEFITAANLCDERVLLASVPITFTADATTNALTLAAGSKLPLTGETVRVSTTGTLPAPLAAATTYYTIVASGVLKLATSYANAIAGTAIDITTTGTGVQSLAYYDEARYTANGSFRTSERPVDILGRILSSMAGSMTQVSDTWRVFGGAYEAATLTLTEADFAGPININPMAARNEWANAAKGVFVDPRSNWQSTDFPAVTSSAYLTEDGGERIWADLDLSAYTTSSPTAQRLAKIELRRRRIGLTVSATFKLSAWRAFTGHSVALTFAKYGWTAKEFAVIESGFAVIQSADGPTLGVRLVLRETSAAIYTWTAEDSAQGTPPSTNLPSPFSKPATITGLDATSGTADLMRAGDGTIITRARVFWNPVTDGLALSSGHIELVYKRLGEANYQKDADIATSATEQYIGALQDGAAYAIRARVVGGLGIPGDWASIVRLIVGKTEKPANVGALTFTDPFLTWPANTDLDLAGYIVRYNTVDDWVTGTPIPGQSPGPGGVSGFITDTKYDTAKLVGGAIYLMIKSIDTTGNEAAAASSLLIDLRPAVPTSFSVTMQADGTREAIFALVSAFDVARIRYFLGTTSTWSAMTPLHTGDLIASPFEFNQLAAGTYTFAIESVDLAGNQSATQRFIGPIVLGDPRIAGSIVQTLENPAWTGTKVDCHVDSGTGWLVANTTATWASAATFSVWTPWNKAPKSPITYTRHIDIGVKVKFTPFINTTQDGTPTIEERHSDDDISYTAFAAVGPLIDARYIDIRTTLSGAYPILKTKRIILSGLTNILNGGTA